jgi:dTDP-4-dehydrorhamnose reductase
MNNILIMGKTGMLGSMLNYYFSRQKDYAVFSTSRKESKENNLFFDAETSEMETLKEFISQNNIDYILNAIGIINTHCNNKGSRGVEKAIVVNSHFPHKLSYLAEQLDKKVINIATDCVYDGSQGNYNEDSPHNALDVYGKTKSLGEVNNKNFLNIRCSIIGPEIKSKTSLLEWFLSQNSEIKGFTHHKWNGITTLRFAQLIDKIIQQDLYDKLTEKSSTIHFVPNYSLTKYEMVNTFNEIFNKNLSIVPINDLGPRVDRTLSTNFKDLEFFPNIDFKEDTQKLKVIMDKDFYNFQN